VTPESLVFEAIVLRMPIQIFSRRKLKEAGFIPVNPAISLIDLSVPKKARI
jgi:hypothetical protein